MDWRICTKATEALLPHLVARLADVLKLSRESCEKLQALGKVDLVGICLGEAATKEDREKIQGALQAVLEDVGKKIAEVIQVKKPDDLKAIVRAFKEVPAFEILESVIKGIPMDWCICTKATEALLPHLVARLADVLKLSRESCEKLQDLGKVNLVGICLGEAATKEDHEKIQGALQTVLADSAEHI